MSLVWLMMMYCVLFSVADPGQQLNQLMQSTVKAASSGLQHLYQTTKDVIKTLQADAVSGALFS